MAGQDYSDIWDCCCDHGLLGLELLERTDARIHFVDIVPELIDRLTEKLERHCADKADRWHTYCMDMARLPLQQEQGRQLVIIAGVGGDLLIQLLDALIQKHPDLDADFLLCPVYHQYAVRQKLIELKLSLLDEVLLREKQRYYELLLVSCTQDSGTPVTPVGNKIWQADSSKQAEIVNGYLCNTLQHYRRLQQGRPGHAESIINDYLAIRL